MDTPGCELKAQKADTLWDNRKKIVEVGEMWFCLFNEQVWLDLFCILMKANNLSYFDSSWEKSLSLSQRGMLQLHCLNWVSQLSFLLQNWDAKECLVALPATYLLQQWAWLMVPHHGWGVFKKWVMRYSQSAGKRWMETIGTAEGAQQEPKFLWSLSVSFHKLLC